LSFCGWHKKVVGGPPSRTMTTLRDASSAEPPRQRWHVEGGEAVVLEPAQVGVEEGAQIGGAVFQHRQTIEAHAPSEALILRRIEAAHLDDLGVDHAAAQDLQPILALTELHLA